MDAHAAFAACAAALAGCGEGKDADKLDDGERSRLRAKALAWLGDGLAQLAKDLEKDTPTVRAQVREFLEHWQRDKDFAGVRDKDALAKLPPAEREAWGKLWNTVAMLLAGLKREEMK